MKINKQSRRINKKTITITIVAVLVLATGYGVFAKPNNLWPFSAAPEEGSTREVNSVNYDPPTEQEVKDSQAAKNHMLEESAQSTNSDSSPDTPVSNSVNSSSKPNKKPVAVNISYADIFEDNLEVRAFTSNTVEAGTCTVTASKSGSSTITKESTAFIDATSTICEPIYIPKSNLSPGTWNVKVTYSSSSYEGSSGSRKVEVK